MTSRGTVLVTGAAGALGQATITSFLDHGWATIGVDRAPLDRQPVDAHEHLVVDLADTQAEATLGDHLASRTLDHVVGIAGGALPGEPETQHDPAQLDPALFRRSLDANLTTQFTMLRATLAALRRGPERDRTVAFTSSFNALSAQGMPAYSAAKAGLIGLMHALVDPLGRDGIRVNVVAPGTVRTPRTERLWGGVEGHFERLEHGTATGRLGVPEDVGRTHLALATLLTHVTGQVLVVDGGQSVVHR